MGVICWYTASYQYGIWYGTSDTHAAPPEQPGNLRAADAVRARHLFSARFLLYTIIKVTKSTKGGI